jgi:hypothetical protein
MHARVKGSMHARIEGSMHARIEGSSGGRQALQCHQIRPFKIAFARYTVSASSKFSSSKITFQGHKKGCLTGDALRDLIEGKQPHSVPSLLLPRLGFPGL